MNQGVTSFVYVAFLSLDSFTLVIRSREGSFPMADFPAFRETEKGRKENVLKEREKATTHPSPGLVAGIANSPYLRDLRGQPRSQGRVRTVLKLPLCKFS